jgi:ATP-dependent DNA helicase RecG
VYDDRIELVSVGGLVKGISIHDIMMGISVCRNSNLANVFYRLQLIEAYGTGMRKIVNAYENSRKKPKIEATDNAFKIILPNLNYNMAADTGKSNNNPDVEKVLKLAEKKGFITRGEVEMLLNCGQSTAGRLLRKMCDMKLLVQKGKGKNTEYHIASNSI